MNAGEPAAAPATMTAVPTSRVDFFQIPLSINHTAISILLRQLQHQRECAQQETAQTESSCEERPLHKWLMGHGFLVVFCLALVGNCLNLLICNSDQIRYYIAIRMLFTKLLMNTLMLIFLVPQALRIVRLWPAGSAVDEAYWKFWPYQAYFANVFGFCAMWLTVLMTTECYLYIFFPGQSKALCTKRNLHRMYVVIGTIGLLLPLIYVLNRTVKTKWHCGRLIVSIVASKSDAVKVMEQIHTIANLLLAIIVPLALLVFMTFSIVWRFVIRPRGCGRPASSNLTNYGYATQQHFSAEKRGVTRITWMTTVLQLFTELPSVPVLMAAALFGPQIAEGMCGWQSVSHFLGLCNASLSFFVYVTFSNRFRKKILRRVKTLLRKVGGHFSSSAPQIFAENSSEKLRNLIASRTNSFVHERDVEEEPNYRCQPPPNYGVTDACVLPLATSPSQPSAATECSIRRSARGFSVTTVLLTEHRDRIVRTSAARGDSYCRSYTLGGLSDVLHIDVNIRLSQNALREGTEGDQAQVEADAQAEAQARSVVDISSAGLLQTGQPRPNRYAPVSDDESTIDDPRSGNIAANLSGGPAAESQLETESKPDASLKGPMAWPMARSSAGPPTQSIIETFEVDESASTSRTSETAMTYCDSDSSRPVSPYGTDSPHRPNSRDGALPNRSHDVRSILTAEERKTQEKRISGTSAQSDIFL